MRLSFSVLSQAKIIIYDKRSRTIQLVKSLGLIDGEGMQSLKVDSSGNDKIMVDDEIALSDMVDKLESILGQVFVTEEKDEKIFNYRLDCYYEMLFFRISIAEPFQNHELN